MSGYLRKIQRYGKSHELARRVTCGIAAAGIFMQPLLYVGSGLIVIIKKRIRE